MKKIIVANWKMNPKNLLMAKKLFYSLKREIKKIVKILKKIEIVICPPFLYLPFLKSKNVFFKLGAQNVFWEKKGAFTGEISPLMLKEFGVDYVIVGHSERRNILKETDEMINKKLKILLELKFHPILCIGESEKERKRKKTYFVLKKELKKAFKNIAPTPLILIAYEPIWAIGTGKACEPKEALEVLNFLKRLFPKNKVLYGGSVNSSNASDYIKVGFDGLLVGGASLDWKEFLSIVKSIAIC